jgi:hypothetical protein
MNESPNDRTQRDCERAVSVIREWVTRYRRAFINEWEPAPLPDVYRRRRP